MELKTLLATLSKHKVRIKETDGRLRVRSETGKLTPEVRQLIGDNKAALLAWLKEKKSDVVESCPMLRAIQRPENLPLSFAQQRLWIVHLLDGPSSAFNLPMAVQMEGLLDAAVIERAIHEIVKRHEALRTTFIQRGDAAYQLITEHLAFDLSVVDMRDAVGNEPGANGQWHPAIDALITRHVGAVFDLNTGPLFDVLLLQVKDNLFLMLVNLHHIVSDGWSSGVLMRELVGLYRAYLKNAPSPLPPLPVQYGEFAIWQRQNLLGQTLERMLVYWRNQLQGAFPPAELPTDKPRPVGREFRPGLSRNIVLSKELSQKVGELSNRVGGSLFMTLMAAFSILQRHYIGNDDIVVGTDVANRSRPELEHLIGFFVNQLVMRMNLAENPSFYQLLDRVRGAALDAYAHQDLPFDALVKDLNPERTTSQVPLYQVKLIFHNQEVPRGALPLLELEPVKIETNTAQLDLSISFFERDECIHGVLTYDTDLFTPGKISTMLAHFESILTMAVANPNIHLDAIAADLTARDEQEKQKKRQDLKEKRKGFSRRAGRRRGVSLKADK